MKHKLFVYITIIIVIVTVLVVYFTSNLNVVPIDCKTTEIQTLLISDRLMTQDLYVSKSHLSQSILGITKRDNHILMRCSNKILEYDRIVDIDKDRFAIRIKQINNGLLLPYCNNMDDHPYLFSNRWRRLSSIIGEQLVLGLYESNDRGVCLISSNGNYFVYDTDFISNIITYNITKSFKASSLQSLPIISYYDSPPTSRSSMQMINNYLEHDKSLVYASADFVYIYNWSRDVLVIISNNTMYKCSLLPCNTEKITDLKIQPILCDVIRDDIFVVYETSEHQMFLYKFHLNIVDKQLVGLAVGMLIFPEHYSNSVNDYTKLVALTDGIVLYKSTGELYSAAFNDEN